jgi:hypothetical protein
MDPVPIPLALLAAALAGGLAAVAGRDRVAVLEVELHARAEGCAFVGHFSPSSPGQ